jgi:hypothetical protein
MASDFSVAWQSQMVCFKNQKYQIGVNFGGPWIGKCLYVSWPFGIFYGHCGYFVSIWYIWWFFPVLGSCTKKNLATLTTRGKNMSEHK